MQKNKTATTQCVVIMLFVLLLSFVSAGATDTAGLDGDSPTRRQSKSMDSVRHEALSSILPNYIDWQTVEIQGKLSAQKLPISPTIRIYMRKGKAIMISARAPFVGEVARVEINGDSIRAVYKLKKIYCEESFSGLMESYPGIISDLQSLLLGHIVVFNDGEINEVNANTMDFTEIFSEKYTVDSTTLADGWVLSFPKDHTDADSFGYEYIVNPSGLVERLIARLSASETDFQLELNYDHDGKKGYDMGISFYADEKQKFNAAIDFSTPKWDGDFPEPMTLNSKYRRLGIKQLLKAI